MEKQSTLKRVLKWLALPVLGLIGYGVLVLATGLLTKEYVYTAFGSDQYNLTVRGTITYGLRYALIEIDEGDDQANILLEAGELDQALRMFETAKAQQSSGWHEVGVLSESHEENPARLTVSAGTGVRFAIHDHGVCFSYDLQPADFAAFERAMLRARKHFDGDAADQGLASGNVASDVPSSAFQSMDKAMSAPPAHANQGCN
jgi:hypothetical protein